jgi:hypothetical protein
VIAIVPSKPKLIAGSLSPFGWSSGVLEKVKLPGVVAALTDVTIAATRINTMATCNANICFLITMLLSYLVGMKNSQGNAASHRPTYHITSARRLCTTLFGMIYAYESLSM